MDTAKFFDTLVEKSRANFAFAPHGDNAATDAVTAALDEAFTNLSQSSYYAMVDSLGGESTLVSKIARDLEPVGFMPDGMYRVKYYSLTTHEHWYYVRGNVVRWSTCRLDDQGARCTAAMWDIGAIAGPKTCGDRVSPSRVPQWVKQRMADDLLPD